MAFGIDDLLVGGLPIVGNILGGIFGGDDKARQQQLLQQQIAELEAQGIPSVEAQRLVLQKAQQEGTYTPEMEQAVSQGNTELANITEDPATRQAQIQALTSLQDVADSGGQSLADKAALQQTLGAISQQERGGRERIAQSMAEKGIGNSGLALAAQLSNQQNAAQNANSQGLGIAGMAQQRALQALQSAGELGGKVRGQDFSQAAQSATAQDAINRFNAANMQGVAQRNAAAGNTGQQYNLGRNDKYNLYNTEVANTQEQQNKGLYQKQYDNQMQKQRALGTARAGGAEQAGQSAQQTAQGWSNTGSGLSGLAGVLFGDKKKKDEDGE